LNLTYYLTLIGSAFVGVFGIVSLVNHNSISVVLFLVVACGFTNLLLLKTKYRNFTRFFLAFIVGLLALVLILTGGQGATGHLWTYPLLTLAFAVLSLREGLFFGFMYLLLVSILFLYSSHITFAVQYDALVIRRYLLSVLALCAMVLFLVRAQEKASNQLKAQTVTDSLTGLFNRAVLNKKHIGDIQALNEHKDSYLLLIDVDYFKKINDNFGHNVGDEVLILLASILRSHIRSSDLAIRWGGEEFLLILKTCPENIALSTAEDIRKAFQSNETLLKMLGSKPTLSIGIAKAEASVSFSEAINTADKKLYKAKHEGRNRVVL
jgi:diguanylate cyclase (GGDEF)-like protein